MTSSRLAILTAISVLTFFTTGCAATTTSTGAPSISATVSASVSTAVTPGGRTYQILPAPTKTVNDPSGLRVAPPTDNPTTLMSAAEAMALCDPTVDGRFAVNGCTDAYVPALIQLVAVTSPNDGTAGEDGSVIPTLDGQTSYLIKFPDQKCRPSGPLKNASSITCERIVVVNASNGAWITAGEYQVG